MSDDKLNMHLFMYEAARLSDEAVDKYFSQHSRADRACIAAALITAYGKYAAGK